MRIVTRFSAKIFHKLDQRLVIFFVVKPATSIFFYFQLCHRSLQSIVQFYYESKKRVKYLNFVNSKCDDSSSSEETETPSPYPEAIFESMCDNCGEKAENMQVCVLIIKFMFLVSNNLQFSVQNYSKAVEAIS